MTTRDRLDEAIAGIRADPAWAAKVLQAEMTGGGELGRVGEIVRAALETVLMKEMGEAPDLYVLRVKDVARALSVFQRLGLEFVEEQHGDGPVHYACERNGVVFEIYPKA